LMEDLDHVAHVLPFSHLHLKRVGARLSIHLVQLDFIEETLRPPGP
jgi:hypothetical protein